MRDVEEGGGGGNDDIFGLVIDMNILKDDLLQLNFITSRTL